MSVYTKMEDGFFSFMDKIGLYNKVIEPLEKKGIKTFPIFSIIIVALIVFLIIFFTSSHGVKDGDNFYITFKTITGDPISNETFNLVLNNQEDGTTITKAISTDKYGVAQIDDLKNVLYSISLNSTNYEIDYPTQLDLRQDIENATIYLKQKTTSFSKVINFKDKSSGALLSSEVQIESVSCSNPEVEYTKEDLPVKNGKLELDDVPADCGNLQVSLPDQYSFESKDMEISKNDEIKVGEVYINEVPKETGNLSLTFLDSSSHIPISGLEVTLKKEDDSVVEIGPTNVNGVVSFSNVGVGNYTLSHMIQR